MSEGARIVKPEPLTADAFAPYGDVIETESAKDVREINYGHTQRFHDLAAIDLDREDGHALVSIFRSTPMHKPIELKIMERHPLGSQAFYPLSENPYLVAVAPAGDFDPAAVRVFLARPGQGVNYHAGTWHHFSLALGGVSDFLVIDRGGPGDNCDEVELAAADVIRIDI